jgi:hypothetical protein
MLMDTTYKGEWSYNPKGQKPIIVPVPAIVDTEIWNLAQGKLAENRKTKAGKQTVYPALMARRMTCICGLKMHIVAKMKGKYIYYRCPACVKGSEQYHEGTHSSYWKSSLVDDLAWEWIKELISNKEKLQAKIENFFTERAERLKPIDDRLAIIQSMKDKYQKQYDGVMDRYLRADDTGKEMLEPKLASLEKLYKETKEELLSLSAKRMFIDYPFDKQDLEYWLQQRQAKMESENENLDNLEFGDKLGYIERFNVQGEVTLIDNEEYVRLTCNFADETLLKLCSSSGAVILNWQNFCLTFSDVLKLDISELSRLKQTA